MNSIFDKDQLQILETYARLGLIPHRRDCPFCQCPMVFAYKAKVMRSRPINYRWKCPYCQYELYPGNTSVTRGINILHFDKFLELYSHGGRMKLC